VARDVGSLTTEVLPGIYRLEYRSGPAAESKLVSIEPGGTYVERDIDIAFPSVAPLPGSPTHDPAHGAALVDASRGLAASGASAGLIVMARDTRGIAAGRAVRLDDVHLQAADGSPVPLTTPAGLSPRDYDVRIAPLAPGGYRLLSPLTGDHTRQQSVWMAPRWQTIIVAAGDGESVFIRDAAIHMVPMESGWDGLSPGCVLLESILWSLSVGRGVDDDLVAPVLDCPVSDPLLAVAAVHAFVRPGLLDSTAPLIQSAMELAPDHPDVRLLPWMVEEASALEDVREPQPVPARPRSWPPMLYASYRALQRWDAKEPGRIRHGSMTEQVSGDIIVDGLWTAWVAETTQGAEKTEPLRPATRRVQVHLEHAKAAGALPDDGQALDAGSVAFATGLPTASVAQALTDLEAEARPRASKPEQGERATLPKELTPAEVLLQRACRGLTLIQFAIAALAFVAALGGELDPPSAVVLLAQAVLIAGLAAIVASNPRGAAMLVLLIVGVQVLQALAAAALVAATAPSEHAGPGDLSADRTVLLWLALVSAVVAIVFAVLYRRAQTARWALRYLGPGAHRTTAAVAEAVHGPESVIPTPEVASNVDAFLATVQTRRKHLLKQRLGLLGLLPILTARSTLALMASADRRDYLEQRLFRRRVSGALALLERSSIRVTHQLVALGYYGDARVADRMVDRPQHGTAPSRTAAGPRLRATPAYGLEEQVIEAEVAVVGSGPSGALLAYRLCESGRSVVVLERGSSAPVESSQVSMLPSIYEDGGLSLVREFDLRFRRAMGLGGGSLMSDPEWSLVPEPVIRRWNEPDHDAGLDLDYFADAVERVKMLLPAITRPAGPLSAGARRLLEGMEQRGLRLPAGEAVWSSPSASPEPAELSEQSVSMADTLLPWGQTRFGYRLRLFTDLRAERLEMEGDTAVAVRASTRARRKIRVVAKTFVVAAGAVDSSRFLIASKLGRGTAGRALSVSLSTPIVADFYPEVLDADVGVQAAFEVDPPDMSRFLVTTGWEPLPLQAILMPGWFTDHRRNMVRYRNMTSSRAHVAIERVARAGYRGLQLQLRVDHLRPLFEQLQVIGDAYLEAGASRVMASTYAYREVRSSRELPDLFAGVARPRDLSLAVRPQGGNPISRNPERGTVGSDFRVHGTRNVYVCDASVFPTAVPVAPTLTALALGEYASRSITATTP
jgi:hypothetical protein